MQVKKEHLFLLVLALFIFAYVLSNISGHISIKVSNNPYSFLYDQSNLQRIPLTIFEIGVKTIALFLSLGLFLSLIEKKYFTKAIVILLLSLLTQLYAIQQIMTKGSLTSMQWTLSISYAGAISLLYVIYFIFQGIVYSINSKLIENSSLKDKIKENNLKDESTVLKPE